MLCFWCLDLGHSVCGCTNRVPCRKCLVSGHVTTECDGRYGNGGQDLAHVMRDEPRMSPHHDEQHRAATATPTVETRKSPCQDTPQCAAPRESPHVVTHRSRLWPRQQPQRPQLTSPILSASSSCAWLRSWRLRRFCIVPWWNLSQARRQGL
jgi:hypothetical protein